MERFRKFGRYSSRVFNRLKTKEDAAYLNFVTDFREEKFSIVWRIENVHRCTSKCGKFLQSPTFTAGPSSGVKWSLRFYPKGKTGSENAALFIKRLSEDPGTATFKCVLSCERKVQNLISRPWSNTFFPDEEFAYVIDASKSSEYGTENLISKDDMKIAQTLVIRCDMYVTKAYNKEDPGNNRLGFSKSESLVQDLKGAYSCGKFSDVTLEAEDVKFPAHKFILAARSKVFEAMFEHDMKESKTNEVHIQNIEPATLDHLLQYIYTGSIDEFNVQKAISLYPFSEQYLLDELKELCVDIMLANLNVENACQMAILTDLYPNDKLKDATFNFFRNYTRDIFKRKEWKKLVRNADRRGLVSEILQAVSADFTTNCSDVK